jgi:dTDP-N-acetylfucosamine:lipid II N-acetylfucosaminyltransferase
MADKKEPQMFLHLVDDEKFTDGSIQLFESCDPGNHRYVIVRGSADKTTRYAKSPLIEFIDRGSSDYGALLQKLGDFTGVFVYSLFSRYHLDLVNRAPQETVFVWFFGGGELLTTKKYWKTVMLPSTRRLYYKHQAAAWVEHNFKKYGSLLRQGHFGELIKPIGKVFQTNAAPQPDGLDANLIKAIARVNYVAPVIPEELEQLRTMTPCSAELLTWNYPIENFSIDSIKDWRVTGNNWLIGNAARYALNHIEILRRLRTVKGHQGRVIVPLSYGDNERYRDDVIKYGYRYFGERFEPLLEFMPVERYFTIVSSCSAAFINTPRQHAMGSILVLLHLGARVYLREENPVYQYLKRRRVVVFPIQKQIPENAEEIARPLDPEWVEKNRDVVLSLGTRQAFLQKKKGLLETLHNRGKKH